MLEAVRSGAGSNKFPLHKRRILRRQPRCCVRGANVGYVRLHVWTGANVVGPAVAAQRSVWFADLSELSERSVRFHVSAADLYLMRRMHQSISENSASTTCCVCASTHKLLMPHCHSQTQHHRFNLPSKNMPSQCIEITNKRSGNQQCCVVVS